jgi:MinD superfamily P-loop ATPase
LRISVASGKGGTGKTTVAANLAVCLAARGKAVVFLDCDVEEPDGHVFLKPKIESRQEVEVKVPHVDIGKCNYCAKCSEICKFNAIAVMTQKVAVFPSLCHSCGGCYYICPEGAISEVPRNIGVINSGHGNGVYFYEGRLNVGEALSPPLTRALKKVVPAAEVTIVDAPPGTSCPVIEAVASSDYVILVTEPTPFGLSDLKLAVDVLRMMNLSFGVVVNRSDAGDGRIDDYCRDEGIDILLKIPFSRDIAEVYSRGDLVSSILPEYAEKMWLLYESVEKSKRSN